MSYFTNVTVSGSVSVGNFPTTQSINQNVVADTKNSYTGSGILGGQTWTGGSVSTLGVAGIQVSLKTDQNCTIYVDQGPDGNNWDIVDAYDYYTGIGNVGVTVQAISSYVRVRVKNNSSGSTSIFRLETALCPIVEALPRSLTDEGNLKVAVREFTDSYGFDVENTPVGEMRVVVPFRLVGSTFSGSTVDTNYWTAGSGSGSVVIGGGQAVLSTGSSANGNTSLQSVRIARYVGGATPRARMVVRFPDSGSANNIRRWGAFSTTDGAFFELNGTNLNVVTRKTGVDIPVGSGSFNGQLGTSYSMPTEVRTWEIYWSDSKVWFTVNDMVLHTMSATSTTWSDTMSLPMRFENNNSGSSASILTMNIRAATIARLGNALSQPTSYYINGQTAGVNLKVGAGNLHSIVFGARTNNAVFTLVDNTSGSTPILFSSAATASTGVPVSLDFKGLPFATGLRLIITGANDTATIIYE